MNDHRPVIANGTTNELKTTAYDIADGRLNLNAYVLCFPAKSEIDEQPFGDDLTALGAENRARNAIFLAQAEYRRVDAEIKEITETIGRVGDMVDDKERARLTALRRVLAERLVALSPFMYTVDDAGRGVPGPYGLGVESGQRFRRGRVIDFANVTLVQLQYETPTQPGAKSVVKFIAEADSSGFPVPREYVQAVIVAGIREHTAGEMWAAQDPSVDKANWHGRVTRGRRDRQALIADAIFDCLCQVF